ncbi:H-2 class I histocompatibility antigen, D-D alpha chain [Tupaia chinensis]|uniref:H-2 class I histocompatibility antigen, D-D alpha chain n=1 Tax=Tupaia chinensis TaxID=246437 RepID=UPI00070418CE|nr:H-2 class I histocompatibility antigen, D-D alpha chain [Tupaia chinensis]
MGLCTRACPPLFLLLLLGEAAAHPMTQPWSHSLRYDLTAISQPSPGQPEVTALGYLDGRAFIAYDSRSDGAKHRGPGVTDPQLAPTLANREAAFWEGHARDLVWGLKTIEGYNELSVTPGSGAGGPGEGSPGPHTLQLSLGCELGNGGGFWRYGYDGEDFTAYHPDTWAWGAALPEPERRRRQLVLGRRLSAVRAWLDRACPAALRSLLAAGLGGPTPVVPPRVVVTQQEEPEGNHSLRCRAFGFSPANITLTWLPVGKELTLDTGLRGTQPAGDGTYQGWAAVQVAPGEEQRYTCLVEHPGLEGPLSVTWGRNDSLPTEEPAITQRHLLPPVPATWKGGKN